ncbi:hypothetical protein DY000_02015843 [Brassica cretica]|uniref:Aspartic peptidase DDI1-type domain-containing protein n=1 Tax=Brassica cretica TaxID=69181 RepID=A0ABQ7D8P8_BRACR|nr:hypothetical protein DY000_02015843 [Brassica cretica]
MFFRETWEKEEDIKRMLCAARVKLRMRITLKKKSDPGQFAIPCTVKGIEFPHALCKTGALVSILPRVMADHLGLQLNWNSSLLLGRAFLSTVGAVCNLQTNQLCPTLIDPNAHYDPIPVKNPHMSSRRINDPGIIAAFHCGVEYETEYSTRPDDWENDYYNPIMAVNDAPPETPDDPYDEEYIKKGILVPKFLPLRPEIQAQVDQIHFLQKPVERELVSAESVKQTDAQRSTERFKNESIGRIAHRTTSILRHRSTLTSQHQSTDSQNSAEEPLIPTVPGNSTGKRRISMEST